MEFHYSVFTQHLGYWNAQVTSLCFSCMTILESFGLSTLRNLIETSDPINSYIVLSPEISECMTGGYEEVGMERFGLSSQFSTVFALLLYFYVLKVNSWHSGTRGRIIEDSSRIWGKVALTCSFKLFYKRIMILVCDSVFRLDQNVRLRNIEVLWSCAFLQWISFCIVHHS